MIVTLDIMRGLEGIGDIANEKDNRPLSRTPTRPNWNETGLQYFRSRMYSASLGRFISRYSAGYVNGTGLYGAYFVPNGVDPTGNFDPLGLGLDFAFIAIDIAMWNSGYIDNQTFALNMAINAAFLLWDSFGGGGGEMRMSYALATTGGKLAVAIAPRAAERFAVQAASQLIPPIVMTTAKMIDLTMMNASNGGESSGGSGSSGGSSTGSGDSVRELLGESSARTEDALKQNK